MAAGLLTLATTISEAVQPQIDPPIVQRLVLTRVELAVLAALRPYFEERTRAGGQVPEVLHYLVAAIVDGVRRPGSWERDVVLRLFGDDLADAERAAQP
jgi:hypothetical protein